MLSYVKNLYLSICYHKKLVKIFLTQHISCDSIQTSTRFLLIRCLPYPRQSKKHNHSVVLQLQIQINNFSNAGHYQAIHNTKAQQRSSPTTIQILAAISTSNPAAHISFGRTNTHIPRQSKFYTEKRFQYEISPFQEQPTRSTDLQYTH